MHNILNVPVTYDMDPLPHCIYEVILMLQLIFLLLKDLHFYLFQSMNDHKKLYFQVAILSDKRFNVRNLSQKLNMSIYFSTDGEKR